MQFNSFLYLAFLPVVFVVYWATARRARAPIWFLLGASYFFYACFEPAYLLLILASSTVDFLVGRQMARTERLRSRRMLLGLSLGYNLGVLATFKYLAFLLGSFGSVASWLGWTWEPPFIDILLPAGISFFTFQSMSYTIDIYRRELEPTDDYARYLTFVAFFPQLVAGPIVRARELLPQLAARPPLDERLGNLGLALIAAGLFKKVAIADYLALNIVQRTFDLPYQFSSVEVLFGVYGYAFQIYCDFSGYSDVAIGSALLLGFRFPANFDSPYAARNLQDFWRRWHISLSTWLRDYLYVSLGGNRLGPLRTYRNLLLTMLLGGLWHGASWNFVVWGALHGGALAVQRALQRRRERLARPPLLRGRVGGLVGAVLTFHFVCFAWIFFRAETFPAAFEVLGRLAALEGSTANLTAPVLAVLGVALVTHLWPRRAFERLLERFVALPVPAQAAALVGLGIGLQRVAATQPVPFIYFQF